MSEPSEIVQALVGLKDVRVLYYERRGPEVDLVIEQVVTDPRCPGCGGPARVKQRPLVRYVDLPVFGTAMHLAWQTSDALSGSGLSKPELGADRSSDRGEELPAHDPGGEVGHGAGRHRPDGLRGRR